MDVVLPAPPRYPLAPTPGQSQSALTLVPLDGTPQAERVIPFAAAHARASGDRLIQVHPLDSSRRPKDVYIIDRQHRVVPGGSAVRVHG